MTFPEAVTSGFNKYAEFSGRDTRSAYWWWQLFSVLVSIACQILDAILDTGGLANAITGLALLIPGLAVLVRRLHDVDKSGWTWLWSLTIIGIVYVLYLLVQPGTAGPNRFGEDPNAPTAEGSFHPSV